MMINQRIEALTMTLELVGHPIEDQRIATEASTRLVAQDAENLRALARIEG